jgi:hypothetical protein
MTPIWRHLANASLLQNAHPTTGLLGQEHQRRKLPAPTSRFAGMGQIGHVDHPTVSASVGLQTLHAALTYLDLLTVSDGVQQCYQDTQVRHS